MISVAVYSVPTVPMAPIAAEIHHKAVFLAFVSVCAAEDVVQVQRILRPVSPT